LLLNCQPVQMYVKISNVSTNMNTGICFLLIYALSLVVKTKKEGLSLPFSVYLHYS